MRHVHLVGSLPASSATESMEMVKNNIGAQLGCCVSDGETGDRSGWMIHIYEAQRRLPELTCVKEGDFSSWEKTPLLGVRPGKTFVEADLKGLSRDCRESLNAFNQLKADLRRDDLAFMIGIPSPLSLAYQIFGPAPEQWQPNIAPFDRATIKQIQEIQALSGGNALFQFEIPIEMALLIEHPAPEMASAARDLIQPLMTLIAACPGGSRFGMHLCWGDQKWATTNLPPDTTPIVVMANAIARMWPAAQKLAYLHAPFVVGLAEPRTDLAYYEPLRKLKLGAGTRFVAGYIDERLSTGTLLAVRKMIETLVGTDIDIASTCGLGRRSKESALNHMRLASAVARAD